ncbi:MAG: HRDC domain-containing protein [Bacteroidota bacterium]
MENYSILTTTQDLEQFATANEGIEWMAIDTEFIGEKRYQTLLCLIQVATPNGLYIFDVLKLPNIDRLLTFIVNDNILKISHAGENDYRLMNELYQIIPKNVFDTQIAAGFVGYRYPISFRALVQAELQIRVNKAQTVTDWEKRPINTKQIRYALNDVIPLKELYDKLCSKINKLGRMEWVQEEMQKIEHPKFYVKDPYREVLNHSALPTLGRAEQLFLVRLFQWRRQLAEERNHSKEMVLAKKYILPIVKTVHLGKDGLKQNRRISERFVKRYGDKMVQLYQQDSNEEELEVIARIPNRVMIPPEKDQKLELLYSFINYRCLDQKVAADLVLPRGLFKQMKENAQLEDENLQTSWRREILGDVIMQSLKNRGDLEVELKEGSLQLKIKAK